MLSTKLKTVRAAGVDNVRDFMKELDVYVKVPFTEAIDLVRYRTVASLLIFMLE